MPQKIKTTILSSILFLTSCVFLTENTLKQTISDNNFLNRFPQNQKAIIIFKLSGKKGDKIYLCEQQNIAINNFESCQSIYVNNQYHILMLKPNLYYLFATPQNRPIFPYQKIIEQEKYLTALQAKSQEITYIGDIFYKQSIIESGSSQEVLVLSRQLKVLDNFALLQKLLSGKNSKKTKQLFANQIWEIGYLIEEYPNLQNYFKKQLLKNFHSNNEKPSE